MTPPPEACHECTSFHQHIPKPHFISTHQPGRDHHTTQLQAEVYLHGTSRRQGVHFPVQACYRFTGSTAPRPAPQSHTDCFLSKQLQTQPCHSNHNRGVGVQTTRQHLKLRTNRCTAADDCRRERERAAPKGRGPPPGAHAGARGPHRHVTPGSSCGCQRGACRCGGSGAGTHGAGGCAAAAAARGP